MKKQAVTLSAFSISLLTLSVCAVTSSDPLLKRGQPVVRALKGSEAHSYRLGLKAGQYVQLIVEQLDIDVIAVVFAPDGKQLGEFDSPTGLRGTELVRFVADTAGEYRIEVRSLKAEAYGGSYEVKIAAIRKATARDNRIVAAVKAQARGDELRAQAETRTQALEQYAQALELWRAARDRAGTGSTLRAIGFTYVRLGDDRQAYEHFDKALTIWREIGDRRSAAYIHLIFATIHTRRGDHAQAVNERLLALPLWRALGDRIEEASTLAVIGLSCARLRDKTRAFDYCQQALALSRATGNRALQANALYWFGEVCELLGEKQQALDYFEQSLALWRALGRSSQEAAVTGRIEKLRQTQ